jgi:hypothetical protein
MAANSIDGFDNKAFVDEDAVKLKSRTKSQSVRCLTCDLPKSLYPTVTYLWVPLAYGVSLYPSGRPMSPGSSNGEVLKRNH